MTLFSLTILLLAFAAGLYIFQGKRLARIGARRVRGSAVYYKWYVMLSCVAPALLLVGLWSLGEPNVLRHLITPYLHSDNPLEQELLLTKIPVLAEQPAADLPDADTAAAVAAYRDFKRTSRGALIAIIIALILIGEIVNFGVIQPRFNASRGIDRGLQVILLLSSAVAILTTIGIVISVLLESIRIFREISVFEFLFSTVWSPQAVPGSFGSVPLFLGTILISLIAMLVAAPIGLMSALYLSEYAGATTRAFVKPMLEVLAGVPTVVYGFFAALTVAPALRDAGAMLGLSVSSESALAAGLTMGIMIIPFISSLSDDVINAVPQSLREGSYALGSTRSETIIKVIMPAALPGIVGGMLLAISRAIGETMIVVMAAGLAAKLTVNPLEAVTTVTVQIVTLLVGDQEFDSPKTLVAFALGLTLFFATLTLNMIALRTVRKYREKYE